jgi:phosphoglycolate phosphatase
MLFIFDLDGTLIDSSRDLAIAMNATRVHVGLPEIDPASIFSFVGNGAAVLVRRALGPDASEDLVAEALAFFLKFYRAHALEHTQVYPGIRETVEQLHAREHPLAVLTNKPARISSDILEAIGLAKYFVQVYGGDSLPAKKPNPIGIQRLLEGTGTAAHEALMIGDSSVDVQTARNAGVAACGVLWGFQPDSLRETVPDFLVEHPREILRLA